VDEFMRQVLRALPSGFRQRAESTQSRENRACLGPGQTPAKRLKMNL